MDNYNPHSCIIVDDDPTSVLILEHYIAQIPKLQLKFSFTDPFLAIKHIEEGEAIDFLFLDIRMKLSGMDVAKKLRGKVRYLVFVTAYKEYALEAFKAECDQYLIKPITFSRLLSTVNEVIKKNHRQSKVSGTNF